MEEQIGVCQTMQQHEDAALKTSMQFFAEELLPYLKIPGKVVGFGPTELVHLDIQKLAQDFNLVMEDGTWKHFEFQSTNEGRAGLRRFRSYEALTSHQHKVEVTTYVLYSGKGMAGMRCLAALGRNSNIYFRRKFVCVVQKQSRWHRWPYLSPLF